MRYVNGLQVPKNVFTSRAVTVTELHFSICEAFANESEGKWTASELMDFSRLWKFEGNETIDDAKEMLS